MSLVLDITIPAEQIKKLADDLSPAHFRQAAYQIVSKTTIKLNRLVKDEIARQVPFLRPKDLKGLIVKQVDKGDVPVGRVIIKHRPIPAIRFPHFSSPGLGTLINYPDGQTVELRHGFVARMKSGHTGIFFRSRFLPQSGPNVGKLNKHGKPLLKLTPAGFAGRLRIEQVYGPPLTNLISLPSVMSRIEFDTQQFMMEQVASQLYRFTGIHYQAVVKSAADSDSSEA
jgi:hypothetical protein